VEVIMSRGCLLLMAVLVLAGPSSAEQGSLGRSPADLYLEEFLRTAEVVQIEDIGEGITRPRRLTLTRDGITHRAIFKTIDVDRIEMSRDMSHNTRLSCGHRDRFVFEVAAYRMDRLLGIGLVPVTVLRTIAGETGSVQYWIERAMTMQDAVDKGLSPRHPELLPAKMMAMYVLDAIIDNQDRNTGNMLVRPATDEFYLIDHSRAFGTGKRLPDLENHRQDVTVPGPVAQRLVGLDDATIASVLDDLLSPPQVRAVCSRCGRLRTNLERRGLMPS
jgi:hypothetical protein